MFKLQHDKKQGTAIVHHRTEAEASYHKHGKEIFVINKKRIISNSSKNTSSGVEDYCTSFGYFLSFLSVAVKRFTWTN